MMKLNTSLTRKVPENLVVAGESFHKIQRNFETYALEWPTFWLLKGVDQHKLECLAQQTALVGNLS